ncbi:MAG: efflux RND transporter periplasmic adaptor subunit [Polyangiaceae bacterium]|nr:efflux RND transporter periplasmic adaptor subunit [Polyangiaceae bacterium]
MSNRTKTRVFAIIGGVVCLGLLGGVALVAQATSTEPTPLSAQPKGVTVIPAREAKYRPTRRFLGTLRPWQEAKIGPQLVSAYVETVLVRPGDIAEQGQVLATLDCRNTAAVKSSVAAKARALDEQQRAIASEAARTQVLVEDGFVSQNEAEQKAARSAAAEAQLQAMRAELASKALQVNDCVLKAPFRGEIAHRFIDPGTFVKPGATLVSIIDRAIVRVTFDVPEVDYQAVSPGTEAKVKMLATGREILAKIARRSPSANPATRTVRVDIDVQDTERALPVGTTAEVFIDVGAPQDAIELPLRAATIRGKKATLFVIDGDVAKSMSARVLGESVKSVFLERFISAGTPVVLEGRSQLRNGDVVRTRVEGAAAPVPTSSMMPAGVKP